MGMAAIGPILFGALYDLQGGYTLAFLTAAAAWGLAGLIVLLAKPPKVGGLPPATTAAKTDDAGVREAK